MKISRMKICRLIPLIGLSTAVPTYIGQSSSVCSWGEWCSFSDCTTEDGLAAQCGEPGTQVRSRECECPDGHSGEPDCPGGVSGMFEEQPCSGPCDCENCGDDCPAECADNCAPCAPSYNGPEICPKGCPSAADVCNLGDFPDFPACPNVCGNPAGTNVTVSAPCECRMYDNDPKNCENLLCGNEPCKQTDSQECSSEECCKLGDWSEWSTCAECRNDGDSPISTRTRECNCLDDSNCDGAQTEETRPCTQEETPPCVTCDWAGWCPWSACSATCEEGEQTRTRKCACSDGSESDSECEGEAIQTQPCNDGPCPPECAWSGWCPWSECNADCDKSGNSTRSRTCWCDDGSESCEGESEESKPCDGPECPVECEWAGWCGWGECSATCSEDGNPAMHTRSRQCKCTKGDKDIEAEEGDCTGDANETEECPDVPACPIRDCQWAGWCAWGECSATCGNATQERTRACRCTQEELDGTETEVYAREGDCGDEPSAQIQPCEGLEPCPDSGENSGENCGDDSGCGEDGCVWGEWCPWSSCTDDCGGIRSRTRKCSCEDQTKCAGSYEEKEECNDACTEVLEDELDNGDSGDGNGDDDGSNRGAGSDNIDPSTGGEGDGNGEDGNFIEDDSNGIDSSGKASGDDLPLTDAPETEVTERECWSPWSDWTECGGATEECPCGGCGTKTRERACQCGDSPDCPGCDGAPSEEEEACDSQQAVCNLGEWSEWTSCNSTCGASAVSERNRECNCPEGALAGCSNGCDGELHEEIPCGDKAPPCCNWTEWCGWSECSKECDSGTHTRSRECRCEDWQGNDYTDDSACGGPSPDFEDEVCNTQSCDGSSDGLDCGPDGDCRSECEKTCENDENPEECNQKCTDDGLEPNGCNLGEWNPWSECTGDCDSDGLQERTRSCSCPETSADTCEDLSSETQPCKTPACPTEPVVTVDSGCEDDSTCPPDDCDSDDCSNGSGDDSVPEPTVAMCEDEDCVIEPSAEPEITVGNEECCDEPECGDCEENGSSTPEIPEVEDDDEDCIDDCPDVEPEECPPEGGTVEPEEPEVPTGIPTIENNECPTDGCEPPAVTDGGCTDSTCEPEEIDAATVTPSAPVTEPAKDDCRGDACDEEESSPDYSGSGDVECPSDECPDSDCPAGDCDLPEPECTDDCPEPECPDDSCEPTMEPEFISVQTPAATVATSVTDKPTSCLCPDESCPDDGTECPPACENNECEEPCPQPVDPCAPDNDLKCEDTSASTCSWGEYCAWSDCTKPCGTEGGRKIRSRKCVCPDGFDGEPDCVGDMFEFAPCDDICPVDQVEELKPETDAFPQVFRLAAPSLEGAGEKIGLDLGNGSEKNARNKRELLEIPETTLPRDFDARTKWSRFITKPSLAKQGGFVNNSQGTCEAEPDVAFSTLASVTADRFAIHLKTVIGVDIIKTNEKSCDYILNEEHATSWLNQTGGIRLTDGICSSPSRLELAWEAMKRSSKIKCFRKKQHPKSKTSSFYPYPSFEFPKFKITSEPDHITNCEQLIDIKIQNLDYCKDMNSLNFAFSKAPIYRVRSNAVEIQHDILHNGPVLSMIGDDNKLESVKILGWKKRSWLVQLYDGQVVKMNFGENAQLESNVMAIVPAKLDNPNDPSSGIILP